jgi:hypothetical protein
VVHVSDRRVLARARITNLRRLARWLRMRNHRALGLVDLIEALARALQ